MKNMSKREWSFDDCVVKLSPKHNKTLGENFNVGAKPKFEGHEITDEILYEYYVIVASIVRFHGEQYLPIFERLKTEIDSRSKKSELLNQALEVSKNNCHFIPD